MFGRCTGNTHRSSVIISWLAMFLFVQRWCKRLCENFPRKVRCRQVGPFTLPVSYIIKLTCDVSWTIFIDDLRDIQFYSRNTQRKWGRRVPLGSWFLSLLYLIWKVLDAWENTFNHNIPKRASRVASIVLNNWLENRSDSARRVTKKFLDPLQTCSQSVFLDHCLKT